MSAAVPVLAGGSSAEFPEKLPLVRPTVEDPALLAARMQAVLESGLLTNGARVRELEERVAARLGVPYVVAVASCTSGLMLTLQALGARGRVVMPSFTFAASAHAVAWAGGTPDFVDVDPESATLDPEAAAAAADSAVAMTATHIYGTPCDVEALQRVADTARIPLVYDAAHALGSVRGGTPVGGFGAAEVFSLSPTKVANAGEGGLVATRDAAIAEAVRLGRDYGNPGDYDCVFAGINARMSELHATVALASLDHLDERIARRQALVARFRAELAGVPGVRYPRVADGDVSTYKDLTLILDEDAFGLSATGLAAALAAEGIDSRRYYAPPIHRQKAYTHVDTRRSLPVTDALAQTVLTVPLWSHMTEETISRVGRTVASLHAHSAKVRSALTESH